LVEDTRYRAHGRVEQEQTVGEDRVRCASHRVILCDDYATDLILSTTTNRLEPQCNGTYLHTYRDPLVTHDPGAKGNDHNHGGDQGRPGFDQLNCAWIRKAKKNENLPSHQQKLAFLMRVAIIPYCS
jgi:hypothetical protein